MTELVKPEIVNNAMKLLPSYWDNKPKARGLLLAYLNSLQNPIDLIFDILNGTALEDAIGHQLDIIGKLWGEDREFRLDNEYRSAIFVKIVNSTFDSTPQRLYEVFKSATMATKLALHEHPSLVYIYMNKPVQDFLLSLVVNAKAAGVDLKLRHPPIENEHTGTLETAFEHRANNILTGGGWINDNLTVSPGILLSPDSVQYGEIYDDASFFSLGNRYQNVTGFSAVNKYFVSMWVQKDINYLVDVMLRVEFTGSTSETYSVRLFPATGTSDTTDSPPLVYRVMDLGDWYFVWMEVKSVDVNNTTMVTRIYPAASLSFGAVLAMHTGNIEIWDPVTAVINPNKYSHTTAEKTGLICSEITLTEFNIVDNLGNQVINSGGNPITGVSILQYEGTGATILSEYNNITYGHPLVEVR